MYHDYLIYANYLLLRLVIVDRLQLRQVFGNIVANAVHAMPEEGALTVKTRRVLCRQTDSLPDWKAGELEVDFVEITFADTGSGIKKDILGKIFEPFFTTKMSGMGLGLPIVKGIIASNDGNITVESEEGKGSMFKIRFLAIED